MATYWRVHPDVSNRDVFDDDSKLYDQEFNEVAPEVLNSNDVLATLTPDQFNAILGARQ